jgi:hypothetical protein
MEGFTIALFDLMLLAMKDTMPCSRVKHFRITLFSLNDVWRIIMAWVLVEDIAEPIE